MEKYIKAAKKLSRDPSYNHLDYLDELNLTNVFKGIFELDFPKEYENKLIAFIIYSYDPDSQKLDIRKDRIENKISIMEGIGIDTNDDLIKDILHNSNEEFNNVVLLFLEQLTDWRWIQIFSFLDYHSNMIRFANQKTEEERKYDKINKEGIVKELTEEYDIETIAKINKNKGDLLNQAMEARKKADELLEQIRREFVNTDTVVQADFGFQFTDTAKKKVDILSWKQWIIELNEKKKKQ